MSIRTTNLSSLLNNPNSANISSRNLISSMQGSAYTPYPGQRSARESLQLIWANYSEDMQRQGSSAGNTQPQALSATEKRKAENFEEINRRYAIARYKRTEVTEDTWTANVLPFLCGLPLAVVSFYLLYRLHPDKPMLDLGVHTVTQFIILLVLLVCAHELIHGITWSVFSKRHWKDIDLGFAADTFTPNCKCSRPLSREAYMTGDLMPVWFTGVIPMAAAVLFGSGMWLMLGIIMMMYAGNDILKAGRLLKYKGEGGAVFFMDFPDKEGGVIFESRNHASHGSNPTAQ